MAYAIPNDVKLWPISLLMLGCPFYASGEETSPLERRMSRQVDTVTVGLGVGVTTSYDGSDEYKLIPGGTLQGSVEGHDFRLNGLQLFVDAIPNDSRRSLDIEFGPVVGLNLNRTGRVRDNQVAALDELAVAVELGARGSLGKRGVFHPTDKLAVSLSSVWDVAGAHDSYVISPSIEYSRLINRKLFMRSAVTAEFVSDRYADYYFRITPAGSLSSGLAAYDPKGGLSAISASLLGSYAIGNARKGWSLFAIGSYKRLQGSVADSPIVRDVGSPNQFFGSIGLGYTF